MSQTAEPTPAEAGPQPDATPQPTDPQATPAQPAPESPETDGQQEGQQPAEPAQPAPEETRGQIDSFAESVGLDPKDFARFNDLASAQAAADVWIRNSMREGLPSPAPSPQQPLPQPQPSQQPTQPAAQYPGAQAQPQQPAPGGAIDLKALGLSEDDPAGKAIRAMEAQYGQTSQTVAQLQQQFQQAEQARAAQAQAASRAEADVIVGEWKDPRFGSPGNQSEMQRLANQRLYDYADLVAYQSFQRGEPIPSKAVRLNRAKRIFDAESGAPPQQPQAPAPAEQATALPNGSPGPAPPAPLMSITDKWSDNPDLRRALGI